MIAIGMETLFKVKQGGSYGRLLPLVAVPAILVNYCVFKMIQQGRNLPSVFIVFSLTNLSLRLVVSLYLKHEFTKGDWVGLGLVFIASLVRALWK